MLENAGLLRRVVHPAERRALCRALSCRQRPRCRKKRRPAFRSRRCQLDRRPCAWAPRAALFATLLPLLAGCGPARNQFAPPCPRPGDPGRCGGPDIDAYRAPGARDLTDLVLHARIVGIQGSCQEGDKKTQLAVTANIGVELTRGPAMAGRDTEVPVFIAVADGDDDPG